MSSKHAHWQSVYQNRSEQQTSWFRPHLDQSLRLIDSLALAADTPVIDVGAGRSTLVDDLLARGFTDVSALDVSEAALHESRQRIAAGAGVHWMVDDVLQAPLPIGHYGLWHDRAVFHFLTAPADRARYVAQAHRSLRKNGVLIVATFAADGPEKCSGLPVCRYDAASLAECFAHGFTALADHREVHQSPFDTKQEFTYLLLRRNAHAASTTD